MRGPTAFGKRTLSDSEMLAYSQNRFVDRRLSMRMRQIEQEAQLLFDLRQKEIIQWRSFRRESTMTTGTSTPTLDFDNDYYPEVTDRRSLLASRESTSSERLPSLTSRGDDLKRLQRPWAYAYSATSHNSVYKETVEAAQSHSKRLFHRYLSMQGCVRSGSNQTIDSTSSSSKTESADGWQANGRVAFGLTSASRLAQSGMSCRPHTGRRTSSVKWTVDGPKVSATERPKTTQGLVSRKDKPSTSSPRETNGSPSQRVTNDIASLIVANGSVSSQAKSNAASQRVTHDSASAQETNINPSPLMPYDISSRRVTNGNAPQQNTSKTNAVHLNTNVTANTHADRQQWQSSLQSDDKEGPLWTDSNVQANASPAESIQTDKSELTNGFREFAAMYRDCSCTKNGQSCPTSHQCCSGCPPFPIGEEVLLPEISLKAESEEVPITDFNNETEQGHWIHEDRSGSQGLQLADSEVLQNVTAPSTTYELPDTNIDTTLAQHWHNIDTTLTQNVGEEMNLHVFNMIPTLRPDLRKKDSKTLESNNHKTHSELEHVKGRALSSSKASNEKGAKLKSSPNTSLNRRLLVDPQSHGSSQPLPVQVTLSAGNSNSTTATDVRMKRSYYKGNPPTSANTNQHTTEEQGLRRGQDEQTAEFVDVQTADFSCTLAEQKLITDIPVDSLPFANRSRERLVERKLLESGRFPEASSAKPSGSAVRVRKTAVAFLGINSRDFGAESDVTNQLCQRKIVDEAQGKLLSPAQNKNEATDVRRDHVTMLGEEHRNASSSRPQTIGQVDRQLAQQSDVASSSIGSGKQQRPQTAIDRRSRSLRLNTNQLINHGHLNDNDICNTSENLQRHNASDQNNNSFHHLKTVVDSTANSQLTHLAKSETTNQNSADLENKHPAISFKEVDILMSGVRTQGHNSHTQTEGHNSQGPFSHSSAHHKVDVSDSTLLGNLTRQSDYTVFKGRRLHNYVRPQDRYKTGQFLSSRKKRLLHRDINQDPQHAQTGRSDLKLDIYFPKQMRRRMLQQLVAKNCQPGDRYKHGVVPPQLRAKIDEFYKTLEPFCVNRCS